MDPGFRNWADSEFIYFTADENAVMPWAEHATEMYREEYWDYPGKMPGYVSKTKPIILRVSKEDLEDEDLIDDPILDELDSDPDLPWVAYLNNIPPELIEVKTPSGWKKLKLKAKGRNKIIHTLKKLPNVEEIYLFGSRSRDEHRPDSDYDVLVVMKPSMNEVEETQKVLRALPWPKYDVKVIGTDTTMTRTVLVDDLHPSTEEGTWMNSESFDDAILLWRRSK